MGDPCLSLLQASAPTTANTWKAFTTEEVIFQDWARVTLLLQASFDPDFGFCLHGGHPCLYYVAQNVLYFLNEFLISVSHHLNSKLHVSKRLNFSWTRSCHITNGQHMFCRLDSSWLELKPFWRRISWQRTLKIRLKNRFYITYNIEILSIYLFGILGCFS